MISHFDCKFESSLVQIEDFKIEWNSKNWIIPNLTTSLQRINLSSITNRTVQESIITLYIMDNNKIRPVDWRKLNVEQCKNLKLSSEIFISSLFSLISIPNFKKKLYPKWMKLSSGNWRKFINIFFFLVLPCFSISKR